MICGTHAKICSDTVRSLWEMWEPPTEHISHNDRTVSEQIFAWVPQIIAIKLFSGRAEFKSDRVTKISKGSVHHEDRWSLAIALANLSQRSVRHSKRVITTHEKGPF